MTPIILAPPIAFVIYLLLAGLLNVIGKRFAASSPASVMKSSIYGSGEIGADRPAAPGYRTFFITALFFAVLHLGVLILASSNLTPVSIVYLVGLSLVLLALMMG